VKQDINRKCIYQHCVDFIRGGTQRSLAKKPVADYLKRDKVMVFHLSQPP
jgi:hypothetical protein